MKRESSYGAEIDVSLSAGGVVNAVEAGKRLFRVEKHVG